MRLAAGGLDHLAGQPEPVGLPEALGLQHVYTARRTEQDTQRQLVKDLLDRAFAGSTSQLVLQALATTAASPAELRQIRRLLDAATPAAKDKEKKA